MQLSDPKIDEFVPLLYAFDPELADYVTIQSLAMGVERARRFGVTPL